MRRTRRAISPRLAMRILRKGGVDVVVVELFRFRMTYGMSWFRLEAAAFWHVEINAGAAL